MNSLESRLEQQARRLGFDLFGIAAATDADTFDHFQNWLAHDFGGEMTYLHRHADARRNPTAVLPSVRSVVMLGMNYHSAPPSPGIGRIATYALGEDYHDVLRARLNALLAWLQTEVPT